MQPFNTFSRLYSKLILNMDTHIVYTTTLAVFLWLNTATNSNNALHALNSASYTRAQSLKAIFNGIENRRLSLLEDTYNGSETNNTEKYFADMEFSESKNIDGLENNSKSKVHYEYDADLNKIEVIIQKWNDEKNIWVKHLREMSYYNNNGNLHENNYQTWSSDKMQWIPICREIYNYDRNESLSQSDLQWQEENGSWSNLIRNNYRYNSNGYIKEQIEQKWNEQSKSWVNTTRHNFGYNSEGYEIESYNQVNNEKNSWENKQKTMYEYASDPEQKRTEIVSNYQIWNNKYWTNTMRKIEINDDSLHQSETISQHWNPNTITWDNQYRKTKTYSENGHLNAAEQFYWNTETNSWEYSTRILHLYDEKNRLSEVINQQWNTTNTQQGWTNITQTKLSYLNDTALDNP